jgi:hypothetical protein
VQIEPGVTNGETSEPLPAVQSGKRRLQAISILVACAIFSVAFGFRIFAAAPPLHAQTVGSTWVYDYFPALAVATNYGAVRDAPPAQLGITPDSPPQSLVPLTKAFEPMQFSQVPYPSTLRPGAYAVLSALAMETTGTTSIRPLLDLQVVLDSLVPVLVFAILLELVTPVLAILGAVLSALWLPEAASASVYYATAMVPFFLTLTLWLYLKGAQSLERSWFVGVGLTAAVLVFLRPELLLLPALLSAYLVAVIGGRQRRVFILALVPILVVGTAVLIASVRNGERTGHRSLTSQTGYALWEGMDAPTGMFPEYAGFYNDTTVAGLLGVRGIKLESTVGDAFDGPKGMEANAQLIRLFVDEVLLEHPVKLFWHVLEKARISLTSMRNWQDAVEQFAAPTQASYLSLPARWIDTGVLVLPFLLIAKLTWTNPNHRLAGVFLIPLLSTHLALALTVGGPLRYTVTLSPCYPILAMCLVGLRPVRRTRAPMGPALGVTLSAAGLSAALVLAALSFGWPTAPRAGVVLDLRLMAVESSKNVVMGRGSGVSLLPNQSATSEVNLIAGQPVEFSPPPYYPGLTSPDDQKQLTDGVVGSGVYDPRWVGWGMNAPRVLVTLPLAEPRFVTRVRVHTYVRGFQLSAMQLWDGAGGGRTGLAQKSPVEPDPSEKTTIGWAELEVGKLVVVPILGLSPTKTDDTYIFIDEIQLLGAEGYESIGEVVFAPVQLAARQSFGTPRVRATSGPGTEVEFSFRPAGTTNWLTEWRDELSTTPIQFRVVLRASPDGRSTPAADGIVFAP